MKEVSIFFPNRFNNLDGCPKFTVGTIYERGPKLVVPVESKEKCGFRSEIDWRQVFVIRVIQPKPNIISFSTNDAIKHKDMSLFLDFGEEHTEEKKKERQKQTNNILEMVSKRLLASTSTKYAEEKLSEEEVQQKLYHRLLNPEEVIWVSSLQPEEV